MIGFDNVSDEHRLETAFDISQDYPSGRTVVVEHGQIICTESPAEDCSTPSVADTQEETVDLNGGAIGPGLTTYGSPLGLVEIRLEPSTNDGPVLDPLTNGNLPALIADAGLIRAVDGLAFEGRGALYVVRHSFLRYRIYTSCRLAYRSGVTTAITAPVGHGFLRGTATAFRLGASHALSKGAIIQHETAVHISVSLDQTVSVSTQISTLRSLLLGGAEELRGIGVAASKIRDVSTSVAFLSASILIRPAPGESPLGCLC